jgi:uncharacterized membrane protein
VKSKIIITLFSFVVISACIKQAAQKPASIDCNSIESKYGANIKPFLNLKCASSGCHDGNAPGDFTTYTGLKTYCDNNKVFDRVFVQKNMPPAGTPQLTVQELNMLECWLSKGAQNN